MELDLQIEILLVKLENRASEHDFRKLYDLLYDRFFRIAVYYLKKDEWAQDVVLDVFVTLWNKRSELIKIKNFDGYCFILLKNASLNYLLRQRNNDSALSDDQASEVHADATPEEKLLNDELLMVYVKALDELPSKCREVFVLVREQGLSYKEVADELNISTKTVDAQIQKAVSRLKEKIKSYFS